MAVSQTPKSANNSANSGVGLLAPSFQPSLPLAIAFIADDGKIVNILEMKAMTEDNHCPTKPVRFALEMNQGWFSKKGVLPGHTITGLPKN